MSKLRADRYNLEDKQLEECVLGTGRQDPGVAAVGNWR